MLSLADEPTSEEEEEARDGAGDNIYSIATAHSAGPGYGGEVVSNLP